LICSLLTISDISNLLAPDVIISNLVPGTVKIVSFKLALEEIISPNPNIS
jgi:hypothetical protein